VSSVGTGVEARLSAAGELCRQKLEEASFAAIVSRLGPRGNPERAFDLLSRVTSAAPEIADLCASIPSDPSQCVVERTLLMLASQHAIREVLSLPVSDGVKELFAAEFQFFAAPPPAWAPHFKWDDVRFLEMARIATLRRFPAGQFHWELAAFPRSWVARASQPLRLLAHVAGMGGFAPLFEMHLNERRKNRLIVLEQEANLTYYRAARSIEKQPEVRGVMMASWLFCETTAQVTPRLSWLRQGPLSGGASVFDLGLARPDSGFMTGSEERRKLNEQGAYRPKFACVLWPRKALIEWANRHPEFAR
jgi:hypothetical protein